MSGMTENTEQLRSSRKKTEHLVVLPRSISVQHVHLETREKTQLTPLTSAIGVHASLSFINLKNEITLK